MKKVIINILRFVSFSVGVGLTINGIFLMLTSNLNIGNILTLTFGIILLCLSLFSHKINKILPLWIKIAFVGGITVVVALSSFLLIYGMTDTVTYKEDALIVLGAGVHGERPSLTLQDRLNTAVDYYNKNNDVIIVVSGGKGQGEDVTEAFAMEKYLLEKGVKSENILKEEKSTSTYENFKNSKEILDERFEKDYKTAFISNEYHIYRANGISKTAGIKDSTHLHSNTRWHSVVTGVLRECLAVSKFWILGK